MFHSRLLVPDAPDALPARLFMGKGRAERHFLEASNSLGDAVPEENGQQGGGDELKQLEKLHLPSGISADGCGNRGDRRPEGFPFPEIVHSISPFMLFLND